MSLSRGGRGGQGEWLKGTGEKGPEKPLKPHGQPPGVFPMRTVVEPELGKAGALRWDPVSSRSLRSDPPGPGSMSCSLHCTSQGNTLQGSFKTGLGETRLAAYPEGPMQGSLQGLALEPQTRASPHHPPRTSPANPSLGPLLHRWESSPRRLLCPPPRLPTRGYRLCLLLTL